MNEPKSIPGQLDPDPVGLVGFGQMGASMARHILASGRKVIGWDRNAEALTPFVEAGGIAASGMRDLSACPLIISIVFDDEATRNITYGPDGLLDIMAENSLHVVMASITPTLSGELDEAHRARGQRFLAASVFGRPEAAAAARLHINCSGIRQHFEEALPVLELLGTSIWLGEDPRQAMLLKSVGNSMITVAVQLLREAFVVLRAGGIDEVLTKEALIDTLFACPIYQGYAQLYIDNPDILRMTDIARKDRTTCLSAAGALGIDMPLVRFLAERDLP